MFRLTALLVAAIYVTLIVFGEPSGSGVAVTRKAVLDGPLLGVGPASAEATAAAENPEPIGAEEAVELALAAGETARPDPEPTTSEATAAAAKPELPVFYVTGSRVNFRAGPSTSESVVGQFRFGDAAEVLSDPSESWVRVRNTDGREGYVFGRFLAPEAPRG